MKKNKNTNYDYMWMNENKQEVNWIEWMNEWHYKEDMNPTTNVKNIWIYEVVQSIATTIDQQQ